MDFYYVCSFFFWEREEKGFADVIEKFEKTERNSISLCIQSVHWLISHSAHTPDIFGCRMCSRTCYKLISIPLASK